MCGFPGILEVKHFPHLSATGDGDRSRGLPTAPLSLTSSRNLDGSNLGPKKPPILQISQEQFSLDLKFSGRERTELANDW